MFATSLFVTKSKRWSVTKILRKRKLRKKIFCFSYEFFAPKNLKKVRKQKYVSQPHLNSTCIILATILSELLSRIFDLSWEKWFQFPWLSIFSQEASGFPERWWWCFLRLPFLKVCVNMRLIVWMIMAAAVYWATCTGSCSSWSLRQCVSGGRVAADRFWTETQIQRSSFNKDIGKLCFGINTGWEEYIRILKLKCPHIRH